MVFSGHLMKPWGCPSHPLQWRRWLAGWVAVQTSHTPAKNSNFAYSCKSFICSNTPAKKLICSHTPAKNFISSPTPANVFKFHILLQNFHMFTYSCKNLHMFTYSCKKYHMFTYSCKNFHIFKYSCKKSYLTYSCKKIICSHTPAKFSYVHILLQKNSYVHILLQNIWHVHIRLQTENSFFSRTPAKISRLFSLTNPAKKSKQSLMHSCRDLWIYL